LIQTQRRQIQRALTNGHERNVTGEDGRQHKANADPVNHCTNLDLPLDVEDSGSTTMGEQQEDPAAAADLQAVEDDLFAEQLHDAIEEALAKLSDHEAAVIRRRYYQR
jgi:DNA-directed RNA polymerase sigma subunit (sigma70/sigma32)